MLGEKSVDDPEWSRWRDSLEKTIGGHSFASFLGVNPSESAKMAWHRYNGTRTRPPPDPFGLKAMNHGKDHERYAQQIYKDFLLICEEYVIQPKTYLASWGTEKLLLALSPDLFLHTHHELATRMAEFKCPYYAHDSFARVEEFRDWWLAKYPEYGRSLYWAQVLLYTVLLAPECDDFHVGVLFVNEADERMVMQFYEYRVTDEARQLVEETLDEIARGKIGNRTKQYKQRIEDICKRSFLCSAQSQIWSLHVNGAVLEEQSEDDPGQDAQSIPWDECFSELFGGPVFGVTDRGTSDQLQRKASYSTE